MPFLYTGKESEPGLRQWQLVKRLQVAYKLFMEVYDTWGGRTDFSCELGYIKLFIYIYTVIIPFRSSKVHALIKEAYHKIDNLHLKEMDNS